MLQYTIAHVPNIDGLLPNMWSKVQRGCNKTQMFHKMLLLIRSSRPEMFFEKDLRPATLLKKRPWHRCLTVNFAKFLRTPFLTEHHRRLLLFWCSYSRYSYDAINKILIYQNLVLKIDFSLDALPLQEMFFFRSISCINVAIHKALHLGCCSSPRSASDYHCSRSEYEWIVTKYMKHCPIRP